MRTLRLVRQDVSVCVIVHMCAIVCTRYVCSDVICLGEGCTGALQEDYADPPAEGCEAALYEVSILVAPSFE